MTSPNQSSEGVTPAVTVIPTAKEHRQKLFGWMSWEMVAQSAGGLIVLTVAWTKLGDKLDHVSEKVDSVSAAQIAGKEELKGDIKEIKAGVEVHTTQLAVNQVQGADEQAKIKVLFEGHAEDQKLLRDISGQMGILLDRTDTKVSAHP